MGLKINIISILQSEMLLAFLKKKMNQRLFRTSFLPLFLILFVFSGKSKAELPSTQISTAYERLATPNPSPEAEAVYRYLQNMFGEKILSGQMWSPWGIDELEYIKEVTGKQPAIRGIDFIHEKNNDMETRNAINWWKAGGIPTIMWHWGAPSIGEGYENSKKRINIQQCFVEGTAENKAFKEELKIKADHLETLKNANVPVLWRPFHELNGDWFWWSMQGPEMFKRLWKAMFDYFVKERELNNLIWVLCYTDEPDISWYPGNDYVDIVAADKYTEDTDSQLKMFENAGEIVQNKLIPIAYHECGTIPDPEKCFKTGAMWSWWMEWHTNHLSKMDQTYLRYIYNHKLVITLDEVPDIMKEYGENIIENNFFAGRIVPFSELKQYTIGSKTKPGNITINNGQLEMEASGSDFWGTKDEGDFLFQQLEGDFDISIQVTGLSPTNLYTKAGIMARVDLTRGSEQVFLLVFPDNKPRNMNSGGCEFQYRDKKSGEAKAIYPDPDFAENKFNVDFPNTWIRLKREGNFFRSYISHDNKIWHLYARHKQEMPEKLLVGLAVTSHDTNASAKAQFSSLQMTWK